MEKIIFAFFGHMGSGKGAAAAYLHETYAIPTFRYSSILRDILKRLYISDERKHIVDLSVALRQTFGNDLLGRVIKQDMATTEGSIVMLDGVRRLDDIKLFEGNPRFVLVYIDASEETRLKRMNARGENVDDANKTAEQLAKERAMDTEASIDEVVPHATVVIDNNGDFDAFKKQLDDLVSRYASTN